MTIDERIEKLTERHEALAQSVEMLNARTADCVQMIGTVGRDLNRLEHLVADIAEATAQLIGGIRNHEQRIQNLEARL